MNKHFILLIALAVTSNAFAGKKIILKTEKLPNGDKKLSVDMNQDGKADTFQVFHDDMMISQESDTKYSGKINEWITYSEFSSDKKPVEVTKRDTNGDGKVDYIESVYKIPSRNQLVTTFESDTKFNGTFDKIWTNVTELVQKKDQSTPCENAIPKEPLVEDLLKTVNKAQSQLNDGFIVTEYGYRIHQSCLDNWGAQEFTAMMNETAKKGFSCLEKLAKDNEAKDSSAPNGAKKNMVGLLALLQSTGINIVCGEKDYDWKGTAGHASTSPGDSLKDPRVRHPFVSISPDDPKDKRKASKEEKNELVKTLFHEQLHNLGIKHNEASIEYPYTCETCCLPAANDKKEEVDLACKICSGVYTSNKDEKYLTDMIAWSKASYKDERAAKAVIAFQQVNPNSRFGLFAYADAAAGTFSPVGVEIAKILKEKFPDRTPEEEAFLERSLDKDYFDHNKKASRYAKVVAEAHIALYYEQDESKAMAFLEKNKSVLKEMLARKENAKENDKYVMDTVTKQMDDLMSAIWMKGYPKSQGPNSPKAYKLMKETGFLK